jgi:hypothetical protein
MSRAYRISVSESIHRVLRAEDCVSTQLEILGVLPPDQMADLLAGELKNRGFKEDGEQLTRKQNGVAVSVDPKTGTVTVSTEAAQKVELKGEKEGRAYDDAGPNAQAARETLRKDLQKDLEKRAVDKTKDLQNQVTDKLEAELGGLRQELDQAVNRVTAEALKVKAASLGQIKELTEDPQAGSLTIVVEV